MLQYLKFTRFRRASVGLPNITYFAIGGTKLLIHHQCCHNFTKQVAKFSRNRQIWQHDPPPRFVVYFDQLSGASTFFSFHTFFSDFTPEIDKKRLKMNKFFVFIFICFLLISGLKSLK